MKDSEKENIPDMWTAVPLSDEIFQRINGCSFRENPHIRREDLRYLKVLHMGFDHMPHTGEIIVNVRIADICINIFKELYELGYPIEKIRLIDEYQASDEASMSDNNSSGFCYRPVSGTDRLSLHALGLAVDINPLYNPYIHANTGKIKCEPASGAKYAEREKDFPYKLTGKDICCRIFKKYGFEWGGEWEHAKDYQHFAYKNIQNKLGNCETSL